MFIKKLILSTLIILGVIASTQAQSNATFNFSCIDYSESELGFDPNQAPLFSGTQTATLVEDGFVEGGQYIGEYPNGMRYPDVNHYAVNIQLTPDSPSGNPGQRGRVTIDAEDDGQFLVATFGLGRTGGSYSTFDEALAAASAIVNNEFIASEEIMLEDLFDLNTEITFPVYNRTIIVNAQGDTAQAEIYVHNYQFRANVEGEDRQDFDTLQEAMDFISSFIYTVN